MDTSDTCTLIQLRFTPPDEDLTAFCAYLPEGEPVFLDIETTGLGWRSSHIYQIGFLTREQGVWTCRQYFLNRPFAEPELLETVAEYLGTLGDRILVHYNGDTFDLPYLREKFKYYQMPIPSLLAHSRSLDLLRICRPWKNLLSLPSLRLRAIEDFLSISREDAYSGEELISVYQRYLEQEDPKDLELLLLHNREDVLHLPRLLPMRAYAALQNEWIDLRAVEQEEILVITGTLSHALPVSLTAEQNDLRLFAESTRVRLLVPLLRGKKKRFIPNYKEYYYLPSEDCAWHRSVAVYVESAHRKKATAATCYQHVEGAFLPAVRPADLPAEIPLYRDAYRAKEAWIRLEDGVLEDPALLQVYISCVLKILL